MIFLRTIKKLKISQMTDDKILKMLNNVKN